VRWLRRYLGNALALILGLTSAFVRFKLTPRVLRPYSFWELLLQLFSTVTTLAGTAALSLDAMRAERVADVLEPFAFLPQRLTPVGIYQFCKGLSEIARENEVEAYGKFQTLLLRFSDSKYYVSFPPRDACSALPACTLHAARSRHEGEVPRSYIGWAAIHAALVRLYNYIGAFTQAKVLADAALAHVTDADRELVALFLTLDIAAATADAALGDVERWPRTPRRAASALRELRASAPSRPLA
jgi:hypothetical protein